MPNHLALAGGEEFRAGCEPMDLEIIRLCGIQSPKVLIIPTAADLAPNRSAKNGVDYFTRLGADAFDLMILNKSDANDNELVQGIHEADIIYFTGGNPDHLLDSLNGTMLLRSTMSKIKDGEILVGLSAGAMVMGSLMRRPKLGQWITGLNIAENIAVLPHHEKSDPQSTSEELSLKVSAEITVFGIDAKTACISTPDGWIVAGTGNVTEYKSGEWKKYSSGEIIAS